MNGEVNDYELSKKKKKLMITIKIENNYLFSKIGVFTNDIKN